MHCEREEFVTLSTKPADWYGARPAGRLVAVVQTRQPQAFQAGLAACVGCMLEAPETRLPHVTHG